jgi:hypothetical protein
VGKWRRRFVDRRLVGLCDEPRLGAPRTISDEDVEAVIVKTLETTPAGETHWSTRTMAANAGMSHTTIGRIWPVVVAPLRAPRSRRADDHPAVRSRRSTLEEMRTVAELRWPPP